MMGWLLSAQNGAALLPALIWQQWWLSAGWSVVVACGGVWFVSRLTGRPDAKVAVSCGLAVLIGLPGPWGGAYWLGLAFQAPSVTTVFLGALFWVRMLLGPKYPNPLPTPWSPDLLFWALCGAVLGWMLLLDTLGVWQGSLYAWGFGAAAPGIALGIAALPWIVSTRALPTMEAALVAMVTFVFVALHLPTGNLFDAVMDPWLWCFLQLAGVQQFWYRFKKR